MITLDEAIKHAEEVAEEQQKNGCLKCAEEHRQLAEWLKDYKRLLEQEPILDKIRAEIEGTGAYEKEVHGKTEFLKGIDYCLGVIDKYTEKAESEEQYGSIRNHSRNKSEKDYCRRKRSCTSIK